MPEPGVTDLNFNFPTTSGGNPLANPGAVLPTGQEDDEQSVAAQALAQIGELLAPGAVKPPKTEKDFGGLMLQIGAILNPRTGENALRHHIDAKLRENARLDEQTKQKQTLQTQMFLAAVQNPTAFDPQTLAGLNQVGQRIFGEGTIDLGRMRQAAESRIQEQGAPKPLDDDVRERIGLQQGDVAFTQDGTTQIKFRPQTSLTNTKTKSSMSVEEFVRRFPGQSVPKGAVGVMTTMNRDGSLADIEFQEAPEAKEERTMRERANAGIASVLQMAREEGPERVVNDPELMLALAQDVNAATVRATRFTDEQGNVTTTGGMDALAQLPPEIRAAVEPLLGREQQQLAEAEGEPVPQGIQESIAGGMRSLELLDILEKNIGETGGFLFTTGAMGFLKSFFGVDSDAEAFAAARNQMRVEGQSIIKGTPSNFDIETYIATIPDFFRAQSTNKARIDLSRSMLKSMIRDSIAFNKAVGRAIPKEMEMRARLMGISLTPIRPMTDQEMANMGSNQWENLVNAPNDVLVDLLNEPGYMERIPDEFALRIADKLEGPQ